MRHCLDTECGATSLGLTGPLVLLLFGFALGLVVVPGPWPGIETAMSYAFAFLIYWMMARLAARGFVGLGVTILVAATLTIVPLAFGPSPLHNRKVMAFNAWAYELGSHLPAIVPPPHPNGVAGALVAAIGLTGAAAFYCRSWNRWVAVLGVVLLITALALTACRAGWLAGAVALTLLASRRGHRWTLLALALAGLIIAVFVVGAGQPQPGQPAILSTESLALRIEQWGQTITFFRERPVTGLGLGRFPSVYARVVAGSDREAFTTPHNVLLQIWADAGMLGLAALGWATVRACHILTILARQHCRIPNWSVIGLATALIALAIHGSFDANTVIVGAVGDNYVHLASPLPFAVLGLLAGLSRRRLVDGPWYMRVWTLGKGQERRDGSQIGWV